MRVGRVIIGAFVALSAAVAACSQILGLEPPPSSDASVAYDVVTVDGGPATCAPLDQGDVAYRPFTNHALDDAGEATDGAGASYVWEWFDLDTVVSGVGGYIGGVFDSRFVYFAPNGSNADAVVMRYDTSQTFASKGSWTSFDTFTSLGVGKEGFVGAVYDGRYVYFVPQRYTAADGGTVYDGIVVRYDTSAPFTSVTSWSTFDTQTIPIDGGALGFASGAFDGRNVYFAPLNDGTKYSGRAARYDTRYDAGVDASSDAASDAAPGFAPLGAWSAYDMGAQQGTALGFEGAAFDGRYVYFVPYENGNANNGYSSTVARYDTTLSFTSASAWSYNQIGAFLNNASGFIGAVFDGTYLYLVPHHGTVTVRYDTTAPFGSNSSWSTFDIGPIVSVDSGAPEFWGGAFDGRFVYFTPTNDGVAVRYDTLSPFSSLCAWSTFDTTTVNNSVVGFFGGIYDGRFLYLPPRGSIVLRFDTKPKSLMPPLPAFYGSFY